MSDAADIESETPKDLVAAAKLPAAFLKKFLDLLEDKVANPELYVEAKITIGELRFLEKHRPELFARPEPVKREQPTNDICEGQEALATRLAQHYQNPDGSSRLSFKITARHVSNWCLLKTPEAAKNNPPGRMAGTTYRYSLSAWIAWVDQYVLPFKPANKTAAGQNGFIRQAIADMSYEDQKKAADARIANAKADRIEKENNEKYTLTEVAAKDGAGLGIAARNSVREVLENQLAPKVSSGLENFIADESTRAAFLEKLRRDGIELVSDFQRHYELCARGILEPENEPAN